MCKFKMKLITFIMVISLFTVAFAAWNIFDDTDDSGANGNIKVEEVTEFKDFATIKFTDVLVYNENGFFEKMLYDTEKQEFVTTPHDFTNAKVEIDVKKIKETFAGAETIKIRLAFRDLTGYEGMFNIFAHQLDVTATSDNDDVEVSVSGVEFLTVGSSNQQETYTEKYINVNIPVTDAVGDKVTININYQFNLDNSEGAYNAFFAAISADNYRDGKAFKLVASLYVEYKE